MDSCEHNLIALEIRHNKAFANNKHRLNWHNVPTANVPYIIFNAWKVFLKVVQVLEIYT